MYLHLDDLFLVTVHEHHFEAIPGPELSSVDSTPDSAFSAFKTTCRSRSSIECLTRIVCEVYDSMNYVNY